MGSGRGDRNQDRILQMSAGVENASMGSGRGDRNQPDRWVPVATVLPLQWGPVVVTGIRGLNHWGGWQVEALQWGPVVVTGISGAAHRGRRPYRVRLQWGPVVVTGIRSGRSCLPRSGARFNGVRSW